MSNTYAKAYVEILEIIEHMEQHYKDKIPVKLIEFFKQNKDINYKYSIQNPNSSFSQETINLLAVLELNYLAAEEEKNILKNALAENEIKYQAEARNKYNPDNLFKNKINKTNATAHHVATLKSKESLFIRIKKWLKRTI